MRFEEEFIKFIENIYPNIIFESADKIKEYLNTKGKNHEIESKKTYKENDLMQGDIISNMSFFYVNENGKLTIKEETAVMIISASCDIENDEYISICPLIKINSTNTSLVNELKSNKLYDRFFLDTQEFQEYYVWFGLISTINKNVILKRVEQSSSKRIFRFNDIGYYLFLIKLNIHLLRLENKETIKDRLEGTVT